MHTVVFAQQLCASTVYSAAQKKVMEARRGKKGSTILSSRGEVTEADIARVISDWTGVRCSHGFGGGDALPLVHGHVRRIVAGLQCTWHN